ncbi:eIF-2B GDP-GTP exchange factor subunit epsilon [Balamuthia mandrillaris]
MSGGGAPKVQQVLQAVVLADSFDTKFAPVTFEMPRSLLPLVNLPTLDYTLEFLVSAGVQEIIVFCCWKAALIQNYLSNSKWSTSPNLTLKTVVSTKCTSTGDALREIYNLQIINADFILISGDVISNMKLDGVLKAHKDRRAKDKRAIMTVVFKKAAPTHRTRSQEDDSIVVIDPTSGQLLHYENEPKQKSMYLDVDAFEEHSSVQFRYDLLDCRIDICSPEVLQVCADNFDYDDLRQDFIIGVVNDEVYKYKIFTHTISNEYAARVNILQTYASVSKDIMYRWSYPMVPDCNFMGTTSFSYYRSNVYKEENIKLARSCVIGRETVLGEGTEVGENTHISHTVIGRNCKIGKNVNIQGSFLWDDVVIEDGVTISNSLLCNDVKVLQNATISKGCILSYKVIVGTGFLLEPFSKLTRCQMEGAVETSLGKGGEGLRWIEKDRMSQLVPTGGYLVGADSGSDSESESESESENGTQAPIIDSEEEARRWVSEVGATVRRAVEENHALENLRLETKTLKLTFENRTFYDCALVVLPTLLDIAQENKKVDVSKSIPTILRKWGGLMEGYLSSLEEEMGLIACAQKYAEENADVAKAFQLILHSLYDIEILDEDAIWEWVDKQKESSEPQSQRFLKQCAPFLKWLEEADEEGSGEDEDDDDEDEDD